MKKILIASACAISLCFTACASKQAPEAEPQTEMAPQIEAETDVSMTGNGKGGAQGWKIRASLQWMIGTRLSISVRRCSALTPTAKLFLLSETFLAFSISKTSLAL